MEGRGHRLARPVGQHDGLGIDVSSNIKIKDSNVARLGFVYGESIENYMNDSPADVGIQKMAEQRRDPRDGHRHTRDGRGRVPRSFVEREILQLIGYSMCKVDNPELDSPGAFHRGQYAIVNLHYYPVANVTTGIEVQYGKRENFRDGFSSDDVKIQFREYNFSKVM